MEVAMSKNALIKSEELPSLLDDFFKPWNEWFNNGGQWAKPISMPAVNVTEDKDKYRVSLAAPGLKKSDFHVDIEGNMLTIRSEMESNKEQKEEKYTRKEYNYSSFRRSFTLPDDVKQEKIEATYEEGVLKLILPKKEEARKMELTKNIAIK